MTSNATVQLPANLDRITAMAPEEMLRYAIEEFGERAAIGTSLQKTGLVLVDMAARIGVPLRVFFVDTLRNHPETYDLLERVEKRYGISIERFQPDP